MPLQVTFYWLDRQRPVVLISAGVGITPMQAMLDTLAQNNYSQNLVYLHACENEAQHSFAKHTAQQCQQQGWQAFTWYRESKAEQPNTFTGMMDFSAIDLPLGKNESEEAGDFYLCGPVGFMQFAKQQLIKLGVDESHIHYEVFGPHANL